MWIKQSREKNSNTSPLKTLGLPCWLNQNCLQCRRPWFSSWVGKIPWRRDRLPTPVFLGFPGGSAGKESACNAGDLDLIPGLGRSPGEGNNYPLQYSGLENPMDCIVHGVTKSQTQLDWATFTLKTHTLHPLRNTVSMYMFKLSDQKEQMSPKILEY